MPDPQPPSDFAVHDVLVSNQSQFDRAGRPTQVSVVSYFVGPHGPFTNTYEMGQGTPEKVRADIQHTVAELRQALAPFE